MSYEFAEQQERRVFDRYVPVKQAFIMSHKSFGIIKNISLGGISVCSVNKTQDHEPATVEVYLSSMPFLLWPTQVTFIDQHFTPGLAITVKHFAFQNLSPMTRDSLWHLINDNCRKVEVQEASEKAHQPDVSFIRHRKVPQFPSYPGKPPIALSHLRDIPSGSTLASRQ